MDAIKNHAWTTVVTPPSPAESGVTIVVTDSSVFPVVPFTVEVWPSNANALRTNAEFLRVTANDTGTNTLTVVRQFEGSSARTIVAGDQIAQVLSEGWLRTFATRANLAFLGL